MRTKTILPRRQKDLLSRYRLLNMLDDVLEYRLTLIAAPAGYGKTSLLVDLAYNVEYPVCWLAIDPLDDDPVRFIHYLVAAISQQFPDFGGASRSLIDNLGGMDLDLDQALRTIINDLYDHVQEHFVLVLDDFHLIDENPEINYFINHFIQEMDENCHLVIATRSLLSLPDLPLMIGRSQVMGLSFEELAFLPEEVKDLYQSKYQQEISDQVTEQIMDESEGWITGLLLTAETAQRGLTDQGRAARAAGIDIYDYLARQVLDQQPPEMRDFLLRTSLFEEFNDELCQQVFGKPEGESSWGNLLNQLLHKNLFIQSIEDGGTWLRYHQLFRDFLRQYMFKHQPQQVKDLLIKLVEVYREQEWFEYAYSACRLLGDDRVTADYLEIVSPPLIHSGKISTLKNWIDELPPGQIENYPGLLASRGVLASVTGDPESGLLMLDRALKLISLKGDPALYGRLLVRRATCHRFLGAYQKGLDDAQRALAILRDTENKEIRVAEAEREIGLNQQRLGESVIAREHLERSLALYLEQDDQNNAAYVKMDLGLMEMNEGHYPAARSTFQQTYQLWEELGNLSELVGLSNNLGVLDHLIGNYREAFDSFKKGLENARQSSNLRGRSVTLASLADLALDLGALPRAEIYITESLTIAEETAYTYIQTYLQFSMAALARIRGDLISAREQLAAVEYRIRDYPAGTLMGRYHLENGFILIAENLPDQAGPEFEAARDIFESNKLPVETCISLVHLARLDCLGGNFSAAALKLNKIEEIIHALGTIQPLVPAFSREEVLLTCLEDHLADDPFTRNLVRAVSVYRSRLPGLLEELELNVLPSDRSKLPFLEIQSMGRVSVKSRGELLSVPEWTKQKTVRELFFYLLSYPEGASREEICLEFWPDSKPEQLKKQFKNALYRLRRAVGKDTILYHPPTRLYHFNRKLDYCYDVEEFYKILELADREADPERKLQFLHQAANLYQHPFAPSLEGIWSEPVRYRLNLDYERIMVAIAEDQFSQGELESSLLTADKLLEAVPSQERAWRLAMQAYAKKGDRVGIERTFQRCRTALAEDLDAEPSKETLALYQELMS